MTQHIENTPIPAPSEDGQNEEEMKEKEIDTSSREYMKNSQQITNMKVYTDFYLNLLDIFKKKCTNKKKSNLAHSISC